MGGTVVPPTPTSGMIKLDIDRRRFTIIGKGESRSNVLFIDPVIFGTLQTIDQLRQLAESDRFTIVIGYGVMILFLWDLCASTTSGVIITTCLIESMNLNQIGKRDPIPPIFCNLVTDDWVN